MKIYRVVSTRGDFKIASAYSKSKEWAEKLCNDPVLKLGTIMRGIKSEVEELDVGFIRWLFTA